MVGVDGELRQDRWQQDGQNRSKVEIFANYLQLLGGGSGERQNNQNSGSGNSSDIQPYSSSKDDGFTDDIPF
jgi:single-strand DNA-binding protein